MGGNSSGTMSWMKLLLVNMGALIQLFWSPGHRVLGPAVGASLRGSYVFSVTKALSVMLEKTKVYKNQWATENDNGKLRRKADVTS